MVENLTLSAAALALLDLLEQQTGIAFEIQSLSGDTVRESHSGDARRPIGGAEAEALVAKALLTGEARVGAADDSAFGVFPLRRARGALIGCLVGWRSASEEAAAASAQTIESAGALARGILESDLALNERLAAAQANGRRLHATVRFLGQLGTYESDRDVLHAVLHAATVWFDLDCRIYRRQPDGGFVLSGALPAVDEAVPGQRLDASRAAHLVATRRFPAAGDFDDLGRGGRKDEVLVLPVGLGEPGWLIVLSGSLDQHAELTFEAIARVLTGDLQAREFARVERRQPRLAKADPDSAAFEHRIQQEVERARRFNLGLGLVLIGAGEARMPQAWGTFDALAAAVRPELRASDLLGRLSTGVVAVLLVHPGAAGADSVTERLSARLSALIPHLTDRVQVGQALVSAECRSAEELIAHARRQSRAIPVVH